MASKTPDPVSTIGYLGVLSGHHANMGKRRKWSLSQGRSQKKIMTEAMSIDKLSFQVFKALIYGYFKTEHFDHGLFDKNSVPQPQI